MKNSQKGFLAGQAALIIMFATAGLLFSFFIGGLATEYTLEHWFSYFQHKQVDVPFWACGLLAIPLTGLFLILAIVTFLASMAGF